jgi:hypothetical protein
MNRFILGIIFAICISSQFASADCTPIYLKKLDSLQNSGGGFLLVSILVVPAPGTVPYGVRKLYLRSLTSDALRLIQEVTAGPGGEITSQLFEYPLKKKIANKSEELDAIKSMIKEANDRSLLCGTKDVFHYKEIRTIIKNGCLRRVLAYKNADYAYLRACLNDPKERLDIPEAAKVSEKSEVQDTKLSN